MDVSVVYSNFKQLSLRVLTFVCKCLCVHNVYILYTSLTAIGLPVQLCTVDARASVDAHHRLIR